MVVLGCSGINGIWVGLANGEVASAFIAVIILKLVDH
jgi:hypothetical protein